MIAPMISMKRLAAVAVLGAMAIAAPAVFAPPAVAGPDRQAFTITFDYDRSASAADNYAAFLREARRACMTGGPRPLAMRAQEEDCVEQTLDNFVRKLGRVDVASVHYTRTGRRIDSSRTLAAR
jgi:hypothetical protein